ncbi:MAG: c-type cytochrome [Alphaproteobacteria bacterium]
MNTRRKVLSAAIVGLAIPAVMLLAQGPAGAQDSSAFQKKCMACHGDAAPAAIKGPSLKGVFGRSVAADKAYAYSDGLKAKSSQKWTQANLDAFLNDPSAWAAGTKMKGKSTDPTERAAIIEALKTYK